MAKMRPSTPLSTVEQYFATSMIDEGQKQLASVYQLDKLDTTKGISLSKCPSVSFEVKLLFRSPNNLSFLSVQLHILYASSGVKAVEHASHADFQ